MRLPSLALLALAAALATAFASQEPEARGATNSKIRFVDLNEALAGYARAKSQLEEFRAAFEPRVQELEKRSDEWKQRERELAPLDPQSTEYRQKVKELKVEGVRLDEDRKFLLQERADQQRRLLLRAYLDIRDAITRYAQANDIEAVFVVDKKDLSDGEDPEERYQRLSSRRVIYHDPRLDITPQVIRLLNT